jgi:hypothetical protein
LLNKAKSIQAIAGIVETPKETREEKKRKRIGRKKSQS